MKRSISILLLLVFIAAPSAIVFSQRTRLEAPKTSKSRTPAVTNIPEAFTDGNGVFVRWHTDREVDTLGFQVYRISNGSKEVVDDRFVPGAGLSSRGQAVDGQEYSLFDAEGTSQSQYYVETIGLNGSRSDSSAIFPKYVVDLTQTAGAASQELVRSGRLKNGYIASQAPVLPKLIQRQVDSSAQIADPVTQRWIAAQPGAKLGVRQT